MGYAKAGNKVARSRILSTLFAGPRQRPQLFRAAVHGSNLHKTNSRLICTT